MCLGCYIIQPLFSPAVVSDNDYYPLQNQRLNIPSSTPVNAEVCSAVTIIGDDIMEGDELFQVAISAVDSNDNVPAVFRITIADDGDSKMTISEAHHHN